MLAPPVGGPVEMIPEGDTFVPAYTLEESVEAAAADGTTLLLGELLSALVGAFAAVVILRVMWRSDASAVRCGIAVVVATAMTFVVGVGLAQTGASFDRQLGFYPELDLAFVVWIPGVLLPTLAFLVGTGVWVRRRPTLAPQSRPFAASLAMYCACDGPERGRRRVT
jgi:hypothetical protein